MLEQSESEVKIVKKRNLNGTESIAYSYVEPSL